jgi:hypothetical protein
MRRCAGVIAARLAGGRKKSQEIIKSISRANQAFGKVFRAGFWHPDLVRTLYGEGANMSDANRLLFLRIALVVIGLTFIFGIYTLGIVWPSGWTWGHGHSHYLLMIIGVYATLGAFLLMASRNPYAYKSIIWFTVWSSVVHGAIMGVQAFNDPAERGHLIADVPALFLVAIVLAVLMPRTAQA